MLLLQHQKMNANYLDLGKMRVNFYEKAKILLRNNILITT